MPFVLAIDGSLSVGTVAVLDGAHVRAERTVAMKGVHEERLFPAVLDAVTAAGGSLRGVTTVVCGAGPGSFTSLRIAAALAKGIAAGAGATLAAVSSHALVIAGAAPGVGEGRYLVVTDALRGECFATLIVVDGAGVIREIGATGRIASDAAAGRAAERGATIAGPGRALDLAPHARGVARLLDMPGAIERVDLDRWEPDYGRLAEAQVKWEAAHGRPLPA